MNKHKFLLEQLDEEVERFNKESTKHKNMYRVLRYTNFIMVAVSTALASLALLVSQWQKPISFIIIFITATIGVISSLEGLRKPGELWIHERTIYYALKDLRRELEYLSSKEDFSEDSDDKYFREMQKILGAAGRKWSQQIVGSLPQNEEGDDPSRES